MTYEPIYNRPRRVWNLIRRDNAGSLHPMRRTFRTFTEAIVEANYRNDLKGSTP